MKLDIEQIKKIILTNPNKGIVAAAKKRNAKLRMHIHGENIKEYLPTIKGFEKPALNELRIQFAKSNRDVFARLGRPIDKVFAATGGSSYYGFTGENEIRARAIAGNIAGGLSVKKWLNKYWKIHLLDDPCGFILMEINAEGVVAPVSKQITTVYDYSPNGSGFDYIVMNVTEQQKKAWGIKDALKYYRLIDDDFDYILKVQSKEVYVVADLTLPNFFGSVPAIVNSDLLDPATESISISLYEDVIELADNYMLKVSMKLTHELKHGFAKYWEVADNCPTCSGTGNFEAKNCVKCSGTGKMPMTNVSDIKLVSHPQTNDEAFIAPNYGGYIEPSKVFHDIAKETIQDLEEDMMLTIWGIHPKKKAGAPATATEIIDDTRPMVDRLNLISEMAEKRSKFIIDKAIQIEITQQYPGCSINYGKRFQMESHDVLWKKYSEARTAGSSLVVLDNAMLDYLESCFVSDPVGLEVSKKMMQVEPFVHYTVAEVKGFTPTDQDYKNKLYFGEWLSTLNEGEKISYNVKKLKDLLTEYAAAKQSATIEPLKEAA